MGGQVEMLRRPENRQQMAVTPAGEGVARHDHDVDVGKHPPQFRRGQGGGNALIERTAAELLPVATEVGVAHVRAGTLQHAAVRLRHRQADDLEVVTAVVEQGDGQGHGGRHRLTFVPGRRAARRRGLMGG